MRKYLQVEIFQKQRMMFVNKKKTLLKIEKGIG